VLGEHGDSEVLCWSSADVGSIAVSEYGRQVGRPLDDAARQRIDEAVRRAAYRIIEGKGATWFGIAGGLVRICRAIRGDERAVLTVSMLGDEVEGVGPVALSLPRVVGGSGIVGTLWPSLTPAESAALAQSARVIVAAAAG
ncbi:MAG: L-lactate dehydrogenase, partial [Geminicoccaceae bacterium]|nr:L-lactate dehydrogenase [Geminicoccaceae bacterium]